MKNALLTSLFFLLSFSSYGQKIHFSDSANVWTFLDIRIDHGTWISGSSSFFEGDSIINGKKWLTYGSFAYYEDTVAGKVFFMTLPDTTDIFLLYDYSLAPGDTIVNQTNELGGIVTSYNKVASIDSTQINGRWYKIWKFNGYEFADYATIIDTFRVIEGIGCIEGLHYPCNPLGRSTDISTQLECFENSGGSSPLSNPVWEIGLLWSFYFDNDSSCHLNLEAANLSKRMENVTVMPNPIDASSRVVFSSNISSGSVMVVNDIGQTVINTTFQNKKEMLIGDKINMPGIYFYRVTDGLSNKTFTGKFIYR